MEAKLLADDTKSSQRILITGGAGFIGSHLVDSYLAAGWTVGVVDNLSTGRSDNLAGKDIKFFNLDLLDEPALRRAFNDFQPTQVSHHAAQVNVRHSLADPVTDAQTNIIGTLNLLRLAMEYSCQQFLFASSGGAIYGENERREPSTEAAATQPMSPYGLSKLAGEQYINWFSWQHNLPVTIFRYANVYGPRQDPAGEAGVITLFLDKFKQQQPAKINGTGEQVRDFVYVDDVAQANLLASQANTTGTFNIASGETTSVKQIYEQLVEQWQQQTGQTCPAPTQADAIPGEVQWSQLNIKKAQTELGWQPRQTLANGLAETVTWARES